MDPTTRRARLDQLLKLAQTYKSWNRRQLAKALGRDTTKLVPESGLPKLDLLMDLARVLDWCVEDVAQYLWADVPTSEPSEGTKDFHTLESGSKAAQRAGDHLNAVQLAQAAHSAAATGEERAIACVREFAGWDGLGRPTQGLEACKRGLVEQEVPTDTRLLLQVNLAIAYYTLWDLLEAKTLAQDLIQRYDAEAPTNRVNRVIQAFSYYVRGHSHRRLMFIDSHEIQRCARQGRKDLQLSLNLYKELGEDFKEESYFGVANTCLGGLIELEVALETRNPQDALNEYLEGLSTLVDPEKYPIGDWLESYGWWCIFGCNVALRHVTDPRALQRYMALLTNKADEIAKRLDNWSMRERVFSLDFARRQRFTDWTGVDSESTIDKEDLRVLTGTMGRFPAFHRTGWQILESAKVVVEQ